MWIIISLVVLAFYIYLARIKPGVTFITSALPFLIFGSYLILNDLFRDTDGIALSILILILPVTYAIIIYSHRNEEKQHWTVTWCRWIFTFLFYMAELALLTLVFRPLGPIMWALMVSLQVRYKSATRYSNTLMIISTIGAAIRQNLPLATSIEISARHKNDKHSLILKKISRLLTQGYSLGESIERGFPKCPTEILAMITASEKIGQLPQTIRTIEADMIAKADEVKRVQPSFFAYPMIVIAISFLITLGLSLFILPTFVEVLYDMSEGTAQLPKATNVLMSFANYTTSNVWVLLISIHLALIIAGFVAYIRITPRKKQRLNIISRLMDKVRWHLPFVGWFEENYSLLTCNSNVVKLRSACRNALLF